jgi:2-polyprenyl-3-methyl-5-hydroxy-6-metoxy-1,4-benzoquinol methylase
MPLAVSKSRLRYLLWAAGRCLTSETSCPFCKSVDTVVVRRKYGVTALRRCNPCKLMFRTPKGSIEESTNFYQSDYEQGFTTDCPPPEVLQQYKSVHFRGTPKDYSDYLAVVRAAGVEPGMSMYDFGCSWGYGSWQMRETGYKVTSWEISRPRAAYAREKMGCNIVAPEQVTEPVDCFFSSHVLEHLDSPSILWDAAKRVLKPNGVVVLFMPNGEARNPNVPLWWGQVHPLLLTSEALQSMATRSGFSGRTYTSPYVLDEIGASVQGANMVGDDLAIVARRAPAGSIACATSATVS